MPERNPLSRRKPQINSSLSTPGRMWLVCCSAGLGVAQSALSDGGRSLIVALTALVSALAVELVITCRESGLGKLRDGSAAASAMVLTLLLPNQIHPVYAALGAVFAMAVVKHSFGGLGSNWLNPALAGWLCIRFSWPGVFAAAGAGVPRGAAGSPLDGAVTSVLNDAVFSLLDAELPLGYIDLLIPRTPGIIADRGLLALLAGTVLITAFRISRFWTPVVFLAVFGILARIAGGDGFGNGDALFAICSGGTIVAAFILAAEPASGPKSQSGALLAAAAGGALSALFRFRGQELYGCFFALALVNVCTQVIRLFEARLFYLRKRRSGEAAQEGPP